MHPDCPTSGGEAPVPGLAKTVKGLAGSNVVQTIRRCSVLGPTLWYEPSRAQQSMSEIRLLPSEAAPRAALLPLSAALGPRPQTDHLLFLFPDRLLAQWALEAGDGLLPVVAATVHIQTGA